MSLKGSGEWVNYVGGQSRLSGLEILSERNKLGYQ